jgi:hypothetical protein
MNIKLLRMLALILSLFTFSGFLSQSSDGLKSEGKSRLSGDLLLFKKVFSGSFDNSLQVKKDTSTPFLSINIVPIWEEYYSDGIWFYEEVHGHHEKILFQRFYCIQEYRKGNFELSVYDIENPTSLEGAYKNLGAFEYLTPDDLRLYPECAIYLTKKGESDFVGSTVRQNCEYGKRNGKYRTTNLRVTPKKIVRSDRIFGWENELLHGPSLESNGAECMRFETTPQQPKSSVNPKIKKDKKDKKDK